MVTGGFKRREEAEAAVASGDVDAVGVARGLVLDPSLPETWRKGEKEPVFPRFTTLPQGGVTAWFTMRMTDLGKDREGQEEREIGEALAEYEERDKLRVPVWKRRSAGQ